MTPYEALDLAQSTFSNSLATYAILLTLVSGYLLTAYMVGSDLTHVQVRLLTVLYLTVAAILIWSMSAYAYWGDVFSLQARSAGVERSVMTPQSWLPAFLAIVNIGTVIGSMFFMWNVRHPKRTGD